MNVDKPRVILLDGLGLNLKTSTVNYYSRVMIPVVSDSYARTAELMKLFPTAISYTNRVYSKFLVITQAIKLAESKGVEGVIVDRGITNILTYHYLNEEEILDKYISCPEDRELLSTHPESYVDLETQLNPIRILITTNNDMILNDGLDESKYDTDEHTQQRIDAYYDPEYYKVVQNRYCEIYDSLTKGNYHHIDLTNDLKTYDEAKKFIVDKINGIIYE